MVGKFSDSAVQVLEGELLQRWIEAIKRR